MSGRVNRARSLPWVAIVAAAAMLGGLALLVAAGRNATAANATVNPVGSSAWSPPSVNIDPGDSVTWNGLANFHWVQSTGSPSFTSSGSPVTTYTFTFTTAGVYQYRCGLHTATMLGTVNVGTPATNTPTDTPPPTDTPTSTNTPTATPTSTATPTASPSPSPSPRPGVGRAVAPALAKD